MDRARLTNRLYLIFLIVSTLGIPLLIVYGFEGSGDDPVAGWIAAGISFIVLLAYTLITSRKQGN